MSVIELPHASVVSDESSTVMDTVGLAVILAAAKSLETPDLYKVIKECLKETERRLKGVKSTGSKRSTKTADAPKGKTPHQLRKNNAWVVFTLKHALENGWEGFVVHSSKKDKETGDKHEEEIEMPASVLHDGAHVYDGSVNESTPAGKQLIHKEAMSLSKQRKGTHPSWEEFLASYEEDEASESESVATKATTSTKSTAVTVRMTAAEKAAIKAEKDAKETKEKADKAAVREAKKAETAAKKAADAEAVAARKAERASIKAEKDAAAAAEKASKDTKKTSKPAAKAAPVKAAVPVKAAAPMKASGGAGAKRPLVVAEEWTPPTGESVKPWSFKGKVYLRNKDNEVWLKGADGGYGEWQGVYMPGEDRIDDSIPEPVFDEEE